MPSNYSVNRTLARCAVFAPVTSGVRAHTNFHRMTEGEADYGWNRAA
jgi:hypothetical protein